MASLVTAPFEVFQDVDGDPLEAGYIYIGQEGLNPVSNPISIYWDQALTIPAAQPIRTIGGFPARSGTPANIFTQEDRYSIIVRNKNQSLVFSLISAGSSLRTLFVADYDELRALNTAPLPDGIPIRVTDAGIGGVGALRNVVAHGLSDNGGTVIVINSNWYWEREYDGPVMLSWFGASTSADSTTALTNAVAVGDVCFDDYYQFDAMFVLSTKRKFTAINDGGMKPLPAGDFTTLNVTADGSVVEGLRIGTVDVRTGNKGHGIQWECDDGSCSNNTIVYGSTTVYHGIRLENANRNVISGNRFTTAPDNSGGVFTTQPGADIAGVDECSDNVVYKNVCDSGNCYGINFTTTVDNTVTRGNIIAENIIDGPLGYGIVLYTDSSDNVVNFLHNKILNNTIRNVSGNVQDTLGAFQFGSGIYLQMCLDTVVMGNTINNVAQSTSGTTLPIGGITGTQCSVAIIGNKIKDSGVTGIYFSSGQINAVYPDRENSKLIIANNTIDGSDNQAIWVNNGRRVEINDNIILDCDSTAINVTSVNVSQFPRVKITGNMVSGAVTGCNVTDAKWLELAGNHFENISAGFSALIGSDILEGFVDRNCSHNATNGFQINSPIRVGENLDAPVEQWQASTAYSQATWVFNGSNVYRCRTAGTSAGSGGPTGTGTEISDNTVEWDYVSAYYAGSYSLYGGPYGIYRTLDDAATPSVKNARMIRTGGTTTITDFTDQHQGQILVLRSSHSVTITHGSGILLSGNADFVMSGGDTLSLCCFDGSNWEEIGRMDR